MTYNREAVSYRGRVPYADLQTSKDNSPSNHLYIEDRLSIYTATMREGSTSEMMQQTMKHFVHCREQLFRGNRMAAEQAKDVIEMDVKGNPSHDVSYINIFGPMLVLVDDVYHMFDINTFTETTSAQDMMNLVWEFCVGLGLDSSTTSNVDLRGIINTAQQPTDELDKWFGPKENRQPVVDNIPDDPLKKAVYELGGQERQSDYAMLGGYDYKQIGIYHSMIGKTVGFDISAIEPGIDNFSNQVYKVYSTYNNKPSTKDEWSLGIRAEFAKNIPDDRTKEWIQSLRGRTEGEWIGVYKVNAGKKEGKVFFNLVRIDKKTPI